MQFEQDNDTYIIYLEKDERIMNGLTQFCKDHKISNGKISGIGAIKKIELGAYDLNNKKYIIQNFNDTATTEIYTLHIVGSVRCV